MSSQEFVLYALMKVDAFFTKHAELLLNVKKYVGDIKSELQQIRYSLQRADASTKEPWLKDLKEVALDIEDVLEDFAHHLKSLKKRHSVASGIKEIKSRLHDIWDRRDRYSIGNNTVASEEMEDPRDSSLYIREDEIVGIEDSMKELENWLTDSRDPSLQLTSVVGMSGIGKTVLVKQVYDSMKVKRHFKFCSWIKVPRPSCTVDGLLKLIVKEFSTESKIQTPQPIESMSRDGLRKTLTNSLCLKRYLLVLDDVWHVDTLSELKNALPCRGDGSRIIATTTRSLEAQAHGRVHEVKPLQSPYDEHLFCKKALTSNLSGVPLELEDLCKKILNTCEGLPVAIVTIGGLLKMKGTDKGGWERVERSLASESSFDDIGRVMSTLKFSYDGLPPHLKSCFLCFGIFPKDQSIKRMKLIRLWIAEGFIKEENDEKDMEEVANDYLNGLIGHSVIQVAERSEYGRVRSYRVHPLMRKFILLNAKEQNFCAFSARRKADGSSSTAKIRRLSISGDDMNNHSRDSDLSHVRSFFAFWTNQSRVEELCSKFQYLRALDLENAPLKNFPESLARLIFLRYLSLENTQITNLPASIGGLRNLQVLNLKGTFVSRLPDRIVKLKNLRHLLAYRYAAGEPSFDCTQAVTVPGKIGKLTALRKLSVVQANDGIVCELGKLMQLRRLGVVGLRSADGGNICSSIAQMRNLESFSAKSINASEPLDLEHQFSPPSGLQRLYLRGRLMVLPHWIRNLEQLTRLTLGWSCLENDPFQELHDLPALQELTLIEAYGGNSLNCGQIGKGRGFPNLKLLCLDGLHELQIIHLECGAMPKLQKMIIRHCKLLSMVPLGIQYLTKLEDVELFDVSPEFVRVMDTEKQHGQALNHINRIYVHDLRTHL